MVSATSVSSKLDRLLALVERDTGNLALRKDAIREACSAGQWDIVGELSEIGLRAHPDEAELLGWTGHAQLQAQRYAEAEHLLSRALAVGIGTPELHYHLAFALFMQKRYSEALERLAAPLLLFELPLAYILRARCLYQLNRHAAAAADCNALLARFPDNAESNGVLALVLYEQGQIESAKRHLEIALAKNPTQLEALLTSALMQADASEYEAARHSFDKLLRAHPQCGRAWFGLALLKLNRRQLKAARRDLEIAATHMPEHIGTWHQLAWIQIVLGDAVAAEATFERALAADRHCGETHGGLALAAALQGRVLDTRARIKRALQLDPQSLSARLAHIVLLQDEGRSSEAQVVLDLLTARPMGGGPMPCGEVAPKPPTAARRH